MKFKDETAFVKHLIKELETAGNLCFRQNPPVNKRANQLYRKGVSDIIMAYDKISYEYNSIKTYSMRRKIISTIYIECKMKNGKLTADQRTLSELLKDVWYTVTPENYKDKLKEFL